MAMKCTVAIALISVVVALWNTIQAATKEDPSIIHLNFSRIHSPGRDLVRVPLPHPVNETAHELISDELDKADTLSSLVLARLTVLTSLDITSQELVRCSAYSHKNHEYELFVARQHLRLAVTTLVNLYTSLRQAYYVLNRTTWEAVKTAELTDLKQFAISAQPYLFERFGIISARKAYHHWQDAAAKAEEVRFGMTTLEREISRLEQIDRVLQELSRALQRLATTLVLNHNHDALQTPSVSLWPWSWRIKQTSSRRSRQERLERLVDRYVVEDGQLREAWDGLNASVDEGEEVLEIRLGGIA